MTDVPPDILPDPAHRHNARVGLWLFALYLLFYAVFVGITVVDYRVMARPVVGGVNLAICYGMFLIVAAIVLAVIVYMLLCKAERAPTAAQERGQRRARRAAADRRRDRAGRPSADEERVMHNYEASPLAICIFLLFVGHRARR